MISRPTSFPVIGPILSTTLGDQYRDPAVTARDKEAIGNILEQVYAVVASESESRDEGAASALQDILTSVNAVNPVADFYENFDVGYTDEVDGEGNFSVSRTGGVSGDTTGGIFYIPPGYVIDSNDDDYLNVNSISTNGSPERDRRIIPMMLY